MLKTKCAIFSVSTFFLLELPASAHVKWFLPKGEQDLLLQPKPHLFTQLGWQNMLVLLIAAAFFYLSYLANRRFAGHPVNLYLQSMSRKWEAPVSLLIGVFTGLLLIKCSLT